MARGERRRLALDVVARLGQLESAHPEAGNVAVARQAHHIGPRADPHLDEAAHLERDDRLAHRGPADVVDLRQLALGRQAAAHRILARDDRGDELARQILVKAGIRHGVRLPKSLQIIGLTNMGVAAKPGAVKRPGP
jgi:hypothetical protein